MITVGDTYVHTESIEGSLLNFRYYLILDELDPAFRSHNCLMVYGAKSVVFLTVGARWLSNYYRPVTRELFLEAYHEAVNQQVNSIENV